MQAAKRNSNKYQGQKSQGMGIQSAAEYVDFFINLGMGDDAALLSFVNNERQTLRKKLGYKNLEKEPIVKGIKILDGLVQEISKKGEKAVLEKYRT